MKWFVAKWGGMNADLYCHPVAPTITDVKDAALWAASGYPFNNDSFPVIISIVLDDDKTIKNFTVTREEKVTFTIAEIQ